MDLKLSMVNGTMSAAGDDPPYVEMPPMPRYASVFQDDRGIHRGTLVQI
jgi:hypothetical protein